MLLRTQWAWDKLWLSLLTGPASLLPTRITWLTGVRAGISMHFATSSTCGFSLTVNKTSIQTSHRASMDEDKGGQLEVGCCSPPLLAGILSWACAGPGHPVTVPVSSQVLLPCCVQKSGSLSSAVSGFHNLSGPASTVISGPQEEGWDIDVPLWSELSPVSYPLNTDQLCLSVLTSICCRQTQLWSVLRDALISGYKDKSAGVGLMHVHLTR